MRGLRESPILGGKRVSLPPPPNNLKCPRCESFDTKFCYYNNYSIQQPRYFCKDCKRYWTQGGKLRKVAHGGRIFKVKRVPITSSTPTYLLSTDNHKSVSQKPNHPHQPLVTQAQQNGGGVGNHGQKIDKSLNQFMPINNNGELMRGSTSICDLSFLQKELDELQSPQLLAQVHGYGEPMNVGNPAYMTNAINADVNHQIFNISNNSSNAVMATANGGMWSTNNNWHVQTSMNTSTASFWYEVLRIGNNLSISHLFHSPSIARRHKQKVERSS